MKNIFWSVAICSLVLASASFARAGLITFVDAVPNTDGTNGNTKISLSGTPTLITLGTNVTTAGSTTDNKWNWDTGSATPYFGGSYLESGAGSGASKENSEPLIVTLSGLAPGQYNLYAFFWGNAAGTALATSSSSPAAGYDVAARVGDTGNFQLFKQQPNQRIPDDLAGGGFSSYTVASACFTSDFSNVTNVGPALVTGATSGTDFMMRGSLGQFTIDGSGSIDIYVDDATVDSVNTRTRTRFDGVGYESVPEPAAWITFCLGLIALGWTKANRD